MPYAPWISPKSGNYLHSRQVRKEAGEAVEEGEAELLEIGEAFAGRGPNFTERAIFYRTDALQCERTPILFPLSLPHACVFFSPLFPPFSPFSSSFSLSLVRGFYFFLRVFFFPLRRYFFLLVAHSFYASLPSLLWTYMRVSMREGHRKPVYTVEYIVAAIRWNVRCAPLWLVTFFLVFFLVPLFDFGLFFFSSSSSLFVKRYGGRIILSKGLCCSRFQYFWD